MNEITAMVGASNQTKVLLVDDDMIGRMGIKCLLRDTSEFEIIGEAKRDRYAIELITELMPDILLMNVRMPMAPNLHFASEVHAVHPEMKILMLAAKKDESELARSLTSGVCGYCLNGLKKDELVVALKVTLAANSSSASMILKSNDEIAKLRVCPSASLRDTLIDHLSVDELETLHMKMYGVAADEMSQRLNVSAKNLVLLEERLKTKMLSLEVLASTRPHESCEASTCSICHAVYPAGTLVCPDDGQKLTLEVLTYRLGTTLGGKYELIDFIGRGGAATVFKARHCFLDKLLALKIMNSDLIADFVMLQRFRGEAEIASTLKHPNIVGVHDFGLTDSGVPFLVMELLKGVDLSSFLSAGGRFSTAEFISVFLQVCLALEYIHAKGLVHRDIKPGNIFLSVNSSGATIVKLVDFGIAKPTDNAGSSQLTAHGQIVGTVGYMSPECCRGSKASIASDIYSLGCTMFECLSGSLPFVGDSARDTMFKHIQEDVPQIYPDGEASKIDQLLANFIEKCLQKNEHSRWQSASAMRSELERIFLKSTACAESFDNPKFSKLKVLPYSLKVTSEPVVSIF